MQHRNSLNTFNQSNLNQQWRRKSFTPLDPRRITKNKNKQRNPIQTLKQSVSKIVKLCESGFFTEEQFNIIHEMANDLQNLKEINEKNKSESENVLKMWNDFTEEINNIIETDENERIKTFIISQMKKLKKIISSVFESKRLYGADHATVLNYQTKMKQFCNDILQLANDFGNSKAYIIVDLKKFHHNIMSEYNTFYNLLIVDPKKRQQIIHECCNIVKEAEKSMSINFEGLDFPIKKGIRLSQEKIRKIFENKDIVDKTIIEQKESPNRAKLFDRSIQKDQFEPSMKLLPKIYIKTKVPNSPNDDKSSRSSKLSKADQSLNPKIQSEISMLDSKIKSTQNGQQVIADDLNKKSLLLKERSDLQKKLFDTTKNYQNEIAELNKEIEKLRAENVRINKYDGDVSPFIDPSFIEEMQAKYLEAEIVFYSDLVDVKNDIVRSYEDELDSLKAINDTLLNGIKEHKTSLINKFDNKKFEMGIHSSSSSSIVSPADFFTLSSSENLKKPRPSIPIPDKDRSFNNSTPSPVHSNSNSHDSDYSNKPNYRHSFNNSTGNSSRCNNSDYQNLGSDYEQTHEDDKIHSLGCLSQDNSKKETSEGNIPVRNETNIENKLDDGSFETFPNNNNDRENEPEMENQNINAFIEEDTNRLKSEINDLKSELRSLNSQFYSLRTDNNEITHIKDSLYSIKEIEHAAELLRVQNNMLYDDVKTLEEMLQNEDQRLQIFIASQPLRVRSSSAEARAALEERLEFLQNELSKLQNLKEQELSNNSKKMQHRKSSPSNMRQLKLYEVAEKSRETFLSLEKSRNNFEKVIGKSKEIIKEIESTETQCKKKMDLFLPKCSQNDMMLVQLKIENSRISSNLEYIQNEALRISRKFGGIPNGKGVRRALLSLKRTSSTVMSRNPSKAQEAIKEFNSNPNSP